MHRDGHSRICTLVLTTLHRPRTALPVLAQEACLVGMPRFSQNQPGILTKGPQVSAEASPSSQDPGMLICLTAAMNTSALRSRKQGEGVGERPFQASIR